MKIGIIGLGYVGLPLAIALAKHDKVVGYDTNPTRIAELKSGNDTNNEYNQHDLSEQNMVFSNDYNQLSGCDVFIVAVPTPVDAHNNPDLTLLLSATQTVAKLLTPNSLVIYESTVYPGCTVADCLPILEQSGLKAGTDFYLGYSPERINPGDKVHTLQNTVKIVAGLTAKCLQKTSDVYNKIIFAGLHYAPSIEVAEAAKIIENTQRDVNIALMNELSIIFSRMKINTYDVLAAAETKWNFLPFKPGLVGGHCIGVDPYYLAYKAAELGYHPQIIKSGRFVNDSMGRYLAKQIVKRLLKLKVNLLEASVLVLGITFKENVADTRNSKVFDTIDELLSYGLHVDVSDPYVNTHPDLLKHNIFPISLNNLTKKYEAILFAVAHNQFLNLDADFIKNNTTDKYLIADVKGIFRSKSSDATDYFSF